MNTLIVIDKQGVCESEPHFAKMPGQPIDQTCVNLVEERVY